MAGSPSETGLQAARGRPGEQLRAWAPWATAPRRACPVPHPVDTVRGEQLELSPEPGSGKPLVCAPCHPGPSALPRRVLPSREAGPPSCPLVDVGRWRRGRGHSGQLCRGPLASPRSAGRRAVPIATSSVWGRSRTPAEVGGPRRPVHVLPGPPGQAGDSPRSLSAGLSNAPSLVLGGCPLPSLLRRVLVLLALWAAASAPRPATLSLHPARRPVCPGPGPGVRLSRQPQGPHRCFPSKEGVDEPCRRGGCPDAVVGPSAGRS